MPGETTTTAYLTPRRLTRWRRAVLRRRRPLAAVAAFVAVVATVTALKPAPAASDPVLVAARDLPAGAVLAASDLHEVRFAPGTVPDGVVAAPEGRVLATAVRRGEPVTEPRLVGPDLAGAEEGLDAVPLRLPDAGAVDLLQVGDRIDLVGTDPQTGESDVVATDVPVWALPQLPDDPTVAATGYPGRLVVVGLPTELISEVTGALVRRYVTYTWSNR